jgi:hypothetical protein
LNVQAGTALIDIDFQEEVMTVFLVHLIWIQYILLIMKSVMQVRSGKLSSTVTHLSSQIFNNVKIFCDHCFIRYVTMFNLTV